MTVPTKAPQMKHLSYLRDRRYRRLVHARLRRFAEENPGVPLTLEVVHRGGCCRIEPWQTTRVQLVDELSADGLRAALVLFR